ncbi:hypothetical protein F3Y22_tig00110987pilonHSYRG00164 [Hibiscus syriacus]|uniref:Reverse transcriptase domain-containing protein n=1 Tax=Hibiscus syriacus TaxID=106335 RepID=A0A6A2Z8R0_HIBSY|nr:hypothetical protein F3Y22_tig00110987pilonHSYRG00164 [Hibiscus syriacus]
MLHQYSYDNKSEQSRSYGMRDKLWLEARARIYDTLQLKSCCNNTAITAACMSLLSRCKRNHARSRRNSPSMDCMVTFGELGVHGGRWACMAVHGGRWTCLGMHGGRWACMEVVGRAWALLVGRRACMATYQVAGRAWRPVHSGTSNPPSLAHKPPSKHTSISKKENLGRPIDSQRSKRKGHVSLRKAHVTVLGQRNMNINSPASVSRPPTSKLNPSSHAVVVIAPDATPVIPGTAPTPPFHLSYTDSGLEGPFKLPDVDLLIPNAVDSFAAKELILFLHPELSLPSFYGCLNFPNSFRIEAIRWILALLCLQHHVPRSVSLKTRPVGRVNACDFPPSPAWLLKECSVVRPEPPVAITRSYPRVELVLVQRIFQIRVDPTRLNSWKLKFESDQKGIKCSIVGAQKHRSGMKTLAGSVAVGNSLYRFSTDWRPLGRLCGSENLSWVGSQCPSPVYSPFLVTFVYASPHAAKWKACWSYLRSLTSISTTSWIIIGDFNATLYTEDRQGCALSSTPDTAFRDLVYDCNLYDLGYHGPGFTWFRNNCYVRLDRALGNTAWLESFPLSSVKHLNRMKPDHRPILLSLSSAPPPRHSPPFRYLSGWSLHSDFELFVHDNWDLSLPIAESIANFTAAARNTKFYHSKASIRRRQNKIHSLKLANGDWCFNDATLREEAVSFFSHLFAPPDPVSGVYHTSGCFPRISDLSGPSLTDCPREDEIKAALFAMSPLKAPGFDGLHAHFYQKNWDIVKPSICRMVEMVFRSTQVDSSILRTILLINIIMLGISSPEIQIQWNGLLSHSFITGKGIRQGDPLSPYLFNLTMERLGHTISTHVSSDDLILYAKADMVNVALLESTLETFGMYSGHAVNKQKTTFFFSPNTALDVRNAICSKLGYCEVTHFGKYLGVPCRSVIKLKAWFVDLFGGSNASSSRIVNWDALCQPLNHGGLGIQMMRVQNFALLFKICNALIQSPTALWITILREKYKLTTLSPDSNSKSCCSPLWRSLASIWPLFHRHIAWSLGNGETARLWHDLWVPLLGMLSAHASPLATLVNDLKVYDVVLPDASKYGLASFFDHSLDTWLLSNLQSRAVCTETQGPWNVLFFISSVAAMEKQEQPLPPNPATSTMAAARCWLFLPQYGWRSFNLRGLRNSEGTCLFAFRRYVGCITVLEVELWGILVGLQFTWQQGCERVVVQTDSNEALSFLSPPSVDSSLALVRAITTLYNKPWFIECKKIYHESDAAVYFIAKMDTPLDGSPVIIDSSPSPLAAVLCRDISGPPYLCLSESLPALFEKSKAYHEGLTRAIKDNTSIGQETNRKDLETKSDGVGPYQIDAMAEFRSVMMKKNKSYQQDVWLREVAKPSNKGVSHASDHHRIWLTLA